MQNKQYWPPIGLVQRHYSGAEQGWVGGIGVVTLVPSDGEAFYPSDYGMYAPEVKGHSKNDLWVEMLMAAKTQKGIPAHTVLFDRW